MIKKLFLGLGLAVMIFRVTGLAEATPVQWTVADGGNNHWYDAISLPSSSWAQANADANAQSFNGMQGHLVTLTSSEENFFVWNNVGVNYYWLGATDEISEGNWKWVTGESWAYTSWRIAQPDNANGNEDYLQFDMYNGATGEWNDFEPGVSTWRPVNGYMVEYEPVPENSAPVADAGLDQSVTLIGTSVQLDGTQSYDPDGDAINYQWTFVSVPAGSTTSLNGANTATPTFIANVHGDYILQLVVTDPWTQSEPNTVTISFDENLKPVANAGISQSVAVGDTVTLDGNGSLDANNDQLTYKWKFSSVPEGSLSAISDTAVVVTTFIPDLPGTYVVQLVVNDGFVDSDPSTIQVEVVSLQTIAIEAVQHTETDIAALPANVFKNANMQNTFLNKLNAVIANIEAGNYADALGQLQNDILGKTDGCATAGLPDKNDWIKDCTSQGIVYPDILNAIAKVEDLF